MTPIQVLHRRTPDFSMDTPESVDLSEFVQVAEIPVTEDGGADTQLSSAFRLTQHG